VLWVRTTCVHTHQHVNGCSATRPQGATTIPFSYTSITVCETFGLAPCGLEFSLLHSGPRFRWIVGLSAYQTEPKKGCTPDNAACEDFFGRLKTEMFYNRNWRHTTVERFIEPVNVSSDINSDPLATRKLTPSLVH
jgi:hypothetical protein